MDDAKIWKPHPKQEQALRRTEFEVLFGGARGPGKTDAGIVWLQKTVHHPRFRGLVIRKNADDLHDWIDRARGMYSGHHAEVVGKPVEIRFTSGAKIRTGHLKDDNAYEKYQGHEYQRMLIEELTQIPDEERYLKLISSCRSTVDGIDPRVFLTTNPGGLGHQWVKRRFVDVAPPRTPYTDPITGRSRVFIPGKIEDNPTLMEKDPGYIAFLEGLPTELKKAWKDGSWDVFVGMFFSEFDRNIHVYEPKDIRLEPTWPRFRSIDWGYASPLASYWHAVGPDQHVYTYREYYGTEKLDVDAAREITSLSQGETIRYTVGDPQSFPVRIPHYKFGQMQSVPRHEVWAEQGIPVIMGDSARIPGWSRMREYLRVRDDQGRKSSWWHISSACTNLIRELTSAVYDKRNIEDISGESSDHALESCRLALMSRPPLFETTRSARSDIEAALAYADREEGQMIRRIGIL